MRHVIFNSVLICSTLAFACGCTSGQKGEPKETRPVTSGISQSATTTVTKRIEIKDADSTRLPLDEYLPTNEENAELQRAEAYFINKCMKELGYPKNKVPILPVAPGRPHDFRTGWFIVSTKDANKYGYDLPPDESSSNRADKDTAWQRHRTKVQDALMNGQIKAFYGRDVPEGGCLGESTRKITAGAQLGNSTVLAGGMKMKASDGTFAARGYLEMHIQAVRNELTLLIETDSRWKSVTKAWSACMAKTGYQYTNPEEAMTDMRWRASADASERTAAATDGKCMDDVNYLGVMISLHSAYEQSFIRQNQEFLKELRTKYEKWLTNARSIIGPTAN